MNQTDNKPRIALWTPLPPLKTGIADYVAELLPHLAYHLDIEIFVDDGYEVDSKFRDQYNIFSYHSYPDRDQEYPFDLNIYQMGNNTYHLYIYQQALRVPGLVVLHDLSLSMILYHYYVGLRNDLAAFKDEFEYSEGVKAVKAFDSYYNQGKEKELMEFFGSRPMLRRLEERNYAILCHLDFAAQKVRQLYAAKHVYTMYLGSPDPYEELGGINKDTARDNLGISKEKFLVGVFGHLQATKQNDVSLRALSRLKEKYSHVLMPFVGPINPSGGYDSYINGLVEKLNLEDHVEMTGFVSRQKMLQYLISCDVIVNLRYPSFGAMSATLSRAIAAGKPIIITDIPDWKFFPQDFCWQVPHADRRGIKLEEYLSTLIEDQSLVESRGQNAREYYLARGTTKHAAQKLHALVDDLLERIPTIEIADQDSEITFSHQAGEMAQQAFLSWEKIWAGSRKKVIYKRLRRFPIIGPIIFAVYYAVKLLSNLRRLWRVEWAFRKILSDGIYKLEQELDRTNQRVDRIPNDLDTLERTIKRLSERTQKLGQQTSNLMQGLVEIHDMPSFRVLENPLGEKLATSQAQEHREKVLEQGKPLGSQKDAFYIGFENVFRGSPDVVRNRQAQVFSYLSPLLTDSQKPVLDVGCGRGELLALLKENDVQAIGVETNPLLVDHLNEEGYKVYHQDAIEFLQSLQNESLAGLTAFHVIEHFEHDYLMFFLALAYKKVIKGGFVYLETPNPFCFESLSNFYTDPTHVRPIQPYQLAFLLEYHQFDDVKLVFQQPVPTRGTFSEERWMRLYQDYGILARR